MAWAASELAYCVPPDFPLPLLARSKPIFYSYWIAVDSDSVFPKPYINLNFPQYHEDVGRRNSRNTDAILTSYKT
jgi:hypothetical protein